MYVISIYCKLQPDVFQVIAHLKYISPTPILRIPWNTELQHASKVNAIDLGPELVGTAKSKFNRIFALITIPIV
jgi:hypothetical protein